jgi:hypothetical protein
MKISRLLIVGVDCGEGKQNIPTPNSFTGVSLKSP